MGEGRLLELDPDALLTTTRTVRKRLDFERAVSRSLIEECLEIAFQAPNGGNMNAWRWIVIDDRGLIERAAEIYNAGLDDYIAGLGEGGYPGASVPGADGIESSTRYLRENFHRSPALLLPLFAGRTEGADVFVQASLWGSIIQAVWSFMLALRARGLGSAWTTGHLYREREMAELLAIPADRFTQVGLFPIAYTIGTDFKRAWRRPVSEVVGWNGFS
jgi:nitroreductase